ncbi:DcrB-related protein [Acidovorax kalamii]|uniref:DUF1795 domain-containing protein n=1 Tax=Acidovorax kalamii TaxID=2004485 RepID=A0A235ELQ0_9BURK|nr:DcrB-related protein [Acidovorax kalamii]OYD49949.1 hypothetical protein CBY09_13480 [Acidovorax kalamii]
MQFHLNEGSFTLPDGLRDNSMNMLLTGRSGLDLSLIITRDRLEPGESFEAFVDRQIKAVTLQVSKFSIQEKHAQKAPDRDQTIAVELAQQFTQNGQVIYQRQRTWLLPDAASVLVLTAASAAPITDAQKNAWLAICASFQPRH